MSNRVREINNELRRMSQTRRRLLEERRQLTSERYVPEHASEFWIDRVFEIIKSHPGISRNQILTELTHKKFTPQVTEQALTNCLTTLRRRGWIENRGIKKYPKWHVKD